MVAVGQTETLIVEALEASDELQGYNPEPVEEMVKIQLGKNNFISR